MKNLCRIHTLFQNHMLVESLQSESPKYLLLHYLSKLSLPLYFSFPFFLGVVFSRFSSVVQIIFRIILFSPAWVPLPISGPYPLLKQLLQIIWEVFPCFFSISFILFKAKMHLSKSLLWIYNRFTYLIFVQWMNGLNIHTNDPSNPGLLA